VKYNILDEYKKYLVLCGLTKTTVNTYHNKMDNLLKGQNFIKIGEETDLIMVLDILSKIKYKVYFSQSKNALLYYLKCFDMRLTNEQLNLIKEIEKTRVKKYRKLKDTEYKKVNATIQRLKNKKLKLSFLTIMETGLRVSELSQIKASDCIIGNEKIKFSFIGKGGKAESAIIEKVVSPNLYKNLEYIIKHSSDDDKLFLSANYLQLKAKKYGFTCHTLRRIYAKKEYKRTRSKKQVKEKLRHDSMKTTNRYLNSRVKMD